MGTLRRSLVFRRFRSTLTSEFGPEKAEQIWQDAERHFQDLCRRYPDISGDSKIMILPAAALYLALQAYDPAHALSLLESYGTRVGQKIAGVIHRLTSIPGVPRLIWKHAPKLMRRSSSPEAGYTRRIVSETQALVAVDILSCPLHDAAVRIGVPEAARLVCAMDKAYMTDFRHIRYTRTTSVAEGDPCCDYRLSYDEDKE